MMKIKIIGSLLILATIGGLFAALKVQAARLETSQTQLTIAIAQAESIAGELDKTLSQRRQLETTLLDREKALQQARASLAKLRTELNQISNEVADEKWQECRAVPVPAALYERLWENSLPH